MRRLLLSVTALLFMVVITALALQQSDSFPLLDWANRGQPSASITAIVIEMGAKDTALTDWSGEAKIRGARVVRREGYRFRTTDQLVGDDGWKAESHRQIRAPLKDPVANKRLNLVSVGVVYHLEEVANDAQISITLKSGEKADVPLADVLAGKTLPLWEGKASVRLLTTATPIEVGKTEDDFPAAAYAPDGTLWLAYLSYSLRDENRRIEQKNLPKQPENFQQYSVPEYADQVFVRSYRAGQWSEPIAVTGPKEDIARCAIAVNGKGDIWTTYSAHRGDTFDIYARKLDAQGKWFDEQRLTKNQGNALTPVMCTDARGQLWLAYQHWLSAGKAAIGIQRHNGSAWESREPLQESGNCWHPALAAGPQGQVTLAYDTYRNGGYDITALHLPDDLKAPLKTISIASSAKFEARPSIVYDKTGRLWIAYEEGPEYWGKDYGALVKDKGNPLYNERSSKVVCLEPDGSLKKPSAELPSTKFKAPTVPLEPLAVPKFESTARFSSPRLGLDGKGNLWLSYRRNFGTRTMTHPGSYWLSFARRFEGTAWSEPIEMHHSDGLLDSRPILLPHRNGGLLVISNTDGRFTKPEVINNDLYVATLSLPDRPLPAPKLVAHEPGNNDVAKDPKVEAENSAVARMRSHRLEVAGRKYQYLRGEYHRHTEISWDGGADGSLEDMFRYGIDAVQFDWIGNGDHDNGAGREYPWWLTQKFTDAYHTANHFTPMFTYERSVAYPMGHRNVMFAKRGIMTLPRYGINNAAKPMGGVHADDTKMLYRYLHEHDGICASHTSATSMGTDWRDNDPIAEPIVEIYQGDRMSYEAEGAPRAGFDPELNREPANIAGWYPKGYINLALQKGYKLGFQASSDHWSTHISFFVILAEKHDRQSMLDAVKKRHCYAATDNILLEFRSGDYLMGDELKSDQAPTFQIHVVGTARLGKVEMLRDSEVVATLPSQGTEFKGTWTDSAPQAGPHYYYLRVQQADGELAWASPIWVEK